MSALRDLCNVIKRKETEQYNFLAVSSYSTFRSAGSTTVSMICSTYCSGTQQ